MTQIVVKLGQATDAAKAALFVHKQTDAPLGEVKRRIDNGEPVAEFRLFYADHGEVAARLRALVAGLPSFGNPLYFELSDDEDSGGIVQGDIRTISGNTVLNIPDMHDREIDRQSNI